MTGKTFDLAPSFSHSAAEFLISDLTSDILLIVSSTGSVLRFLTVNSLVATASSSFFSSLWLSSFLTSFFISLLIFSTLTAFFASLSHRCQI
jgi:hypothetical protein